MTILHQSIAPWVNGLLVSLQYLVVALRLDRCFSKLDSFDVLALSCACWLKLVNYNLPNILKMTINGCLIIEISRWRNEPIKIE